MDYLLRCKASDRVLLRTAFIAIGVLEINGQGDLQAVPPGALDTIGPMRNQLGTDWVRVGGEIAHHYNLRVGYDLRQKIIDLAAQGDATAQVIIANRARFYAKIGGNLKDTAPDAPKRVFL